MPHHTPLISTIVVALVLAFVLGAIANRFRISPLVGYLLAGVVIGPFTPGYVADPKIAGDLAEIGVILLMFGVGLHFTLEDLLSVRAIAVPGALVQIASATVLGMGLAWLLGWSIAAGLVFGLVGYGRVGRVGGGGLKARQIPVLLIEETKQAAAAAKQDGMEVIRGTGTDREVLEASNLAAARCLLVAIPDAFEGGQVVAQTRAINPGSTSSRARTPTRKPSISRSTAPAGSSWARTRSPWRC